MKRIIACILALLMTASVWVFPVSAASLGEALDCTAFTADQSGDGWQWSHGSNTLTLNGLEITSPADGIVLPNGAHLRLSGTNSIDAQATGVLARGILFVEGSGTLDILSDGVGLQAGTVSFQTGTPLLRIQSTGTGMVLTGGLTIGNGAIHSQNGMNLSKLNSASVRVNGGAVESANGPFQTSYSVAVGKPYTVTVTSDSGLEVTGGGEYIFGESVSLSATPADRFASWSSDQVKPGAEASTGFVMPAQNVTVTAKAKTEPEQPRTALLRFQAGEGGKILTPNGSYPVDSTVRLEAQADEGYVFVGWSAEDGTFSDASSPVCDYTVNKKGGVITATFQKLPAGITITPDVGGIAKPDSGDYTPGTKITLEATPNPGYVFTGWEASAGTLETPSSAKCVYVVPEGSALVTAHFAKENQNVSITITATEGGKIVQTQSKDYAPGTKITLKTVANEGYVFAGWKASAGTLATPSSTECVYTVPATAASVVAHFTKKTGTLTVLCDPAEAGTLGTAGGQYQAGDKIELSVTLKDPVNFMFLGWASETGSFSDEKSSRTTFTMPEGDATVKALFASKINNLTVTATEGGHVLLENGTYVDHLTPLSEDARLDSKQTFVAEALEGYYFTGWSVSVGTLTDSASATLRYVMPGSPVVLTANFTKASYELTVSATEGGTVNTSGGRKNLGATVELVATPKDGYRFAGWAVKCTDPALAEGVILAPDSMSTTMTMPACPCQVTAQFASLADGTIQTTAAPSQVATQSPISSAPTSVDTSDEDAPVEKTEGLPGWVILLGACVLAALGVLFVIHRERRVRNGHVSVYKELFAKHNMKALQKQETQRLRKQEEEKNQNEQKEDEE